MDGGNAQGFARPSWWQNAANPSANYARPSWWPAQTQTTPAPDLKAALMERRAGNVFKPYGGPSSGTGKIKRYF